VVSSASPGAVHEIGCRGMRPHDVLRRPERRMLNNSRRDLGDRGD
jgi:hypothetical protein